MRKNENPDLVTVRESASRELTATGARLFVEISGESIVSGAQALDKAREVAACVTALREAGLSRDDVRLRGVTTEVQSGVLTKSSRATYRLEVRCDPIERLGKVLAAISSQKNAKVSSVGWNYPDVRETKLEVLRDAVDAARKTAATIADALDVDLSGIHELSYDVSGLDTDGPAPALMDRARKRGAEALENLNLSHAVSLYVSVTAKFHVARR